MIPRTMQKKLQQLAKKFPVVALLGPRQSGKTTLAQTTFPQHAYLSLEDLDHRLFATEDPRGFLETYQSKFGLILDEIQHVPSLLSYIQTDVDKRNKEGFYILTGSQNYLISQSLTQTLAGRIAILTLLPLTIEELKDVKKLPSRVETALFHGFYPRIYAKEISPLDWYPNYISTYLERDVRQIKNVTDLTLFQKFLKLCAGRIGQILNLTSLSNDCGISVNTVKGWLSILESSYILFMLQPYYKNFSKRLIKSPKLYFYDTGIASSLLGIQSPEQLSTHYLRGGLFESAMIADLIKQRCNQGLPPNVYFWRDKAGEEIDCILEDGKTIPIEIKSGKTISSDYFDSLEKWVHLTGSSPSDAYVIYAGSENQKRKNGQVRSWQSVDFA